MQDPCLPPRRRVRDDLVAGDAEQAEGLGLAGDGDVEGLHMVPFVLAGPELRVAEAAAAPLRLVLRVAAALRKGLSLRLQ